jgi:hypothetical protein
MKTRKRQREKRVRDEEREDSLEKEERHNTTHTKKWVIIKRHGR